MKTFLAFLLLTLVNFAFGQSNVRYDVDLSNRYNHEAVIKVTLTNLPEGPLEMRMSRSSPGRYALHEFAKNVYNVSAVDGRGKPLSVTRPDPHRWNIGGHDHTVVLTYTLFGDRGDGTYAEFDGTHAHMNIPATFMIPRGLEHRPVVVNIGIPEGSNWKVATQLKRLDDDSFYAPNQYYFMDSPIEVSDFMLRSYESMSNGKSYRIRLALHHEGSSEEADQYFESVKKVVEEQKKVFGEFPDFDFGEYTFLACYTPGASGDGMEHRNSTVVSGTRSLKAGGMRGNIGTVSHEFFHAWNVERIRPRSLEPFDFDRANMSGELWFAEGFTSYYTNLILCRAGLRTPEEYVRSLQGTINAVVNGPGRNFFSPIEMSYRAPFVDAARSVDPQNTSNIFISYYTYGSALGLALDLSLRNLPGEKSLDGYFQQVWAAYGKKEIPYQIQDLKAELADYAGLDFATRFFDRYIYRSEAPDYKTLLASVGVLLEPDFPQVVFTGAELNSGENGWTVVRKSTFGTPAYKAGLVASDVITKVNAEEVGGKSVGSVLGKFKPGDQLTLEFKRGDQALKTTLVLGSRPDFGIALYEDEGMKISREIKERRNRWLGSE